MSCGKDNVIDTLMPDKAIPEQQGQEQVEVETSVSKYAETSVSNNKDTSYTLNRTSQRDTSRLYRGKVERIPDFFQKEEKHLFEDSWTAADTKDYQLLYKLSNDKVKEDEMRTLIQKLRNTSRDKDSERREIKEQIKTLSTQVHR
jgi:hypothetical protein